MTTPKMVELKGKTCRIYSCNQNKPQKNHFADLKGLALKKQLKKQLKIYKLLEHQILRK